MASSVGEVDGKTRSLRRGSLRATFYIVTLVASLFVLNFIFGWTSLEEMPPFLQPYINAIMPVKPYFIYVQAALILVFGYLIVGAVSETVYAYMRRVTDRSTANTIRAITRTSGYAALLPVLTSVFYANPAAALTIGSFGGLVVGFATQTIFSHVLAGIFLLISRPFTYGDTITILGQTGVVKEIKLMHLVMETEDGTKDVLIPSGVIIAQMIQKKRPAMKIQPIATTLALNPPPKNATVGSTIMFTGKLVETEAKDPVKGATVRIFEQDIGKDDSIASGVTGDDGSFSIQWTAKKVDPWDYTAEIYAKFEGNDNLKSSKSDIYIILIKK